MHAEHRWDHPEVTAHLRDDALGAMLYGSAARGDSNENSDIDVLQLVESSPGGETRGRVSIVNYTQQQLEAMVRGQSLFAWHLRTEGVYLHDSSGALRAILESHLGPDPAQTLGRVRALAVVLDLDGTEFERHATGVISVARFLLRTAVYAVAIGLGSETFSTARAAGQVDPSGRAARLLHREQSADVHEQWLRLSEMKVLLGSLAGPLLGNPYGSLEALVVRTEGFDEDAGTAALALHILANEVGELDYARTGMPIL